MIATTTTELTLEQKLRAAIGDFSFDQHREYWTDNLRDYPDVIDEALTSMEKRRRGNKVQNPGGWMFTTVRREIEERERK